MSPDLPRVLVSAVLMLSPDIIHRTTGHKLLLPTVPLPVTDVVASVVLSQDILVLVMDMDMELVVSVEELVFTQLGPSMNPDLLKVLVSVVPNPDILVMDSLLMVMLLAVSAEELVSMPQDLSMSPDLPRVLVSAVLMLSPDIIHRTSGHPLLLPTVPPPVTDAVASVV